MSKSDNTPLLYELAIEMGQYHTSTTGASLAVIAVNGREVAVDLDSGAFEQWLSKRAREQKDVYVKPAEIKRAIIQIKGDLQEEEATADWMRVARLGDAIYIDKVSAAERVIEVKASGWCFVDDPPVVFIRPMSGTGCLPKPKKKGDINLLRGVLNLRENQYRLAVGWLLASFNTDLDTYPVLQLWGPEGCGKTMISRNLIALSDPKMDWRSNAEAFPHSIRSLRVTSAQSHAIGFDNLSGLTSYKADALCQIASGILVRERTLYKTKDITPLKAKCALILASIDQVSTRPDLLDRTLLGIPPPLIKKEPGKRKEFEDNAGIIFAGILDALSNALKYEARTKYAKPGRLVDLCQWTTAAETNKQLGWRKGGIVAAYKENIESMIQNVLDSYPMWPYLFDMVKREGEIHVTSAALLKRLENAAGEDTKQFPGDGGALSMQLNRLTASAVKAGVGIDTQAPVSRLERGVRIWLLER